MCSIVISVLDRFISGVLLAGSLVRVQLFHLLIWWDRKSCMEELLGFKTIVTRRGAVAEKGDVSA